MGGVGAKADSAWQVWAQMQMSPMMGELNGNEFDMRGLSELTSLLKGE